ncbi:hypothetical protein A2862_03540 [Candidatus Roizmanbacteria bacterium RIFCSPHIGHO2_01_FULL_38_41]|nr:MAG: hypothetical protein A2862_03540 [Candidatus Roizmanbacteria bacterium RIFCSPHIGHO2_01_FULL_38_41]
MWRMAYIAAMRLDSIPTKWALNYDRIGLIEPEVPGDPLPQPPSDPLVACSPREWNRVPLGSWISGDADHPWEVEFRGDSAFGTYPGTTLVGPANLRYFWGDCDPGRWWEPFAFERLLAQEKDPFGPTIGVEWDPFRFVRDGRLFLPYVWGNAEPIEGYP